jgi:hypothetical protein
MNYKRRIAAVYVFKNGMVAVFDQWGIQLPFFQGKRSEAMPKIKSRLDRQKGSVYWKIQEGANFAGETGVINYA